MLGQTSELSTIRSQCESYTAGAYLRMRIVGIQVIGAVTMMPRATAWLLLIVSTLGGPVSVYYLLFSIWMTSHPLYDSQAWRIRVYERFGITVLDGLIWLVSIVWLWRMAKVRQTSE